MKSFYQNEALETFSQRFEQFQEQAATYSDKPASAIRNIARMP